MNGIVKAGDLLKNCIDQQKLVVNVLEHGIDEGYNDTSLVEYFTEVHKNSIESNSEVCRKVADYCQLLNNEENCENVSLGQIQELYELLIKVHPLDMGFYQSLAYFLSNVMDKPEEGRQVLSSGIEIIESEIVRLKAGLNDFE